MPDMTQQQSNTFVERAVLLIEQQSMAMPEPLRVVDAQPSRVREMPRKVKSLWPAQIAAFASVFALGICLGNWLGNGTQAEFHFANAMAQDAGSHPRLNALQLRIDTDFASIQPLRR